MERMVRDMERGVVSVRKRTPEGAAKGPEAGQQLAAHRRPVGVVVVGVGGRVRQRLHEHVLDDTLDGGDEADARHVDHPAVQILQNLLIFFEIKRIDSVLCGILPRAAAC